MAADASLGLPNRLPNAVTRASQIIWWWILFLAVSGVYQGFAAPRQLHRYIPSEIPTDFLPSDGTLFVLIAGLYWIAAISMIGVAIRLKDGKNWARVTLLVSLIFDVVFSVFSFPGTAVDNVLTVIDLGMQIYALWLVYSKPGSLWFKVTHAPTAR